MLENYAGYQRGQPTTCVNITYLLAGSFSAFAHTWGLKLPQTTVLRLYPAQ